jgi:tetratricopeptide (TPR) repeat protein
MVTHIENSPFALSNAAVDAFVDAARPLIARGPSSLIASRIREHWNRRELRMFLHSQSAEAVCLASICLGLIGSQDDCDALAAVLKSPREQCAAAAEQALWRIWMRAGSEQSNLMLQQAVLALNNADHGLSRALLQKIIADEPDFAEAHHQLGIVLSLQDDDLAAADAFQHAIRLNPHHFQALIGLGNAYAATGNVRGALARYLEAREIHPTLAGLSDVINELERLARRYQASA